MDRTAEVPSLHVSDKNTPALIYGAYGYTGELICDHALSRGLRPVVAGRDADRVQRLADSRGLDARVVALDQPERLRRVLDEFEVVVHCAGPFSQTFEPMVEACLATSTHYLDITGEWQVFQGAAERCSRAEEAGIMLLPGVGFDVVPSDCLAAHLKERLPEASSLALGFQNLGRPSRGTSRTAVEGMNGRGQVLRDGLLCQVPAAWKTRTIDFGRGPRLAATIPWGDVVTAWFTTGIPNVEVFMATSPRTLRFLRWSRWIGFLLQSSWMQGRLLRQVETRPAGPDSDQRKTGQSLLWGEAKSPAGEIAVSRLVAPEGYSLTAATAVVLLERVLAGDWQPGFQTPGGLYGPDLILEIPGVERVDESIRRTEQSTS